MKLPQAIHNKVLKQHHLNDFLLTEINQAGRIIDFQGNQNILPTVSVKKTIQTLIAGLETENFDEDFFIPFYHLNEKQVVDIHHYEVEHRHYLVLVPQDQVHQELQSKQQMALESQLQNQNLRTMLSTLQRTQSQLKQVNQDKSFLISALSHEMGTPLNSIQGHAQMALADPSSIEQALKVILKSSQHLQQIIDQTLNIDRNESHQNKQSFNLKTLLTELHESLFPLASFKALTFTVECPDQLPIYSHRSQWQQILTNLITNAIKYTNTGGISIIVTLNVRLLTIDVEDSGVGISPAFQNKLFQSWQREKTTEAKGSGIGLVIAKMLAESLGLTLTLEHSSADGSCFRVCDPQYKHSTQRVLLIEDDEDLRRLFVYYLEQLSLDIQQASSWQEVQTQFKSQKFDVILTDRHLADGKADEHLLKLQQLAPKILVMTGNPDRLQTNALYQMGFHKVLSKPLSQKQLEQALLS